MDAPKPVDEAGRVAALESYNILDSAPEPAYDDITALAAKISECPLAAINLIGESRRWIKAMHGAPGAGGSRPREETVCFTGMIGPDPLIVPDLTKDERFSDLDTAERFRFYFGMPLINPEGYSLGTLCVLDKKPRELTADQQVALRHLAGQVMTQFELRRLLAHVEEMNRTLEEKVQEQVEEIARVGRFRRFLSPQIAEKILADDCEDLCDTHRSEITVTFIDLRGFTAFSDSAEPEEVMEFLRVYHAEVGGLIFKHEGTVEHFAGDGIMAFFGDPVPREDHTEMAVRMAGEVIAKGKEICAEWKKKGYDLAVGIGMASGYATMGTIGFEGRLDYGAVGVVTILASRLSNESKGGQILTDQKTLARIESLVEAEALGEIALKGFARPVAAFNIQKVNG